MEFQDYVKFATENPVCYMASTDGDQPRVRALLMWFAKDDGFYFATFSPRPLYQQVKVNPKVEVCFYNNAADLADAKMMRVIGEMEVLDDPELQEKVAQERGFLEQMAGQPLDPLWRVLRLHTGEVHFWTLPDVLKESDLERVKF